MLSKSTDRAPETALRPAALLLLLAAEAGATGALFDAEPILGRVDAWWARLLAHGGMAGPLAIAVGTALLLFGESARDALPRGSVARGFERRDLGLLALQVLSFGLSLAVASVLFGEGLREATSPGAWALAWATLLAVALVAWLLLVLPARAFARLARGSAGLLVACVATGTLAWWAGHATAGLWLPLRDATVALVATILSGAGLEVARDDAGVTLALGDFAVDVGPTCSGYEGIGLMTVFVGAFLAWFRDVLRFPNALLLLPAGIAAAWLGNGLRLAALLEIGARLSPAVAMGGFHAYSGSLLFSAIALGLATVARRSPFFSTGGDPGVSAVSPPSDAPAYLLPWLALLATSMATGAASAGGADPLYALRLLAAVAVLFLRAPFLRGLAVAPEPAAFALGALAFGAWLALAPGTPADGVASSWPAGAAAFALRAAGAVAIVPLVEELAFRGYLARRVVDRDFATVPGSRVGAGAIAVAAIAFGLLHDRLVAGLVAGVLFGLALRRRGEVADAVAAHATTNALLLGWVTATGRWDLWG